MRISVLVAGEKQESSKPDYASNRWVWDSEIERWKSLAELKQPVSNQSLNGRWIKPKVRSDESYWTNLIRGWYRGPGRKTVAEKRRFYKLKVFFTGRQRGELMGPGDICWHLVGLVREVKIVRVTEVVLTGSMRLTDSNPDILMTNPARELGR